MEIIVLIPTFLCLLMYFRYSVQQIFLNLYVPLFAFLPMYYYWKVSALPPIDFGVAILLPLGLGMLIWEARRWHFTTVDLWLFVFVFSSCCADQRAHRVTASIFNLFQVLCTAAVPYMAGRLLIEQGGARVKTVKRLVFCLFLACPISMYEYRMSYNPFTLVWARFFPSEVYEWKTQLRWGFGRISGPFGQSELAGIVLMCALGFALWLGKSRLWELKFTQAPWLPFRKATFITVTILIALLMTQARGPWLGAFLAIPIAYIGRSRTMLKTSLIVGAAVLVLGGIAYIGFQHYIAGPASSESQESAQYRQQLVSNYLPIAVHGGLWGWGTEFPRVPGQDSIDNEYLFVLLTQGFAGFVAFCLLAAETLGRLTWAGIYAPTRLDRTFAFSLLGIFAGILLTVYTVFLGNQPYQLFFLLAGWAQALPAHVPQRRQLGFEHVYS